MQDVNENETNDTQGDAMMAELCIDHDHVTVDMSRYEELLTAENTVEVIRAIRTEETIYDHDALKVIDLLVGVPKKDTNGKTGGEF